MSTRSRRVLFPVLAIGFCFLLFGAASASAAVRFAAPGGIVTGNCTDKAEPCSLFRAADARGGLAQPGDKIILAAGTYGSTDLDTQDLAVPLMLRVGTTVVGDLTRPGKPLIQAPASKTLVQNRAATIAFVNIRNTGTGAALTMEHFLDSTQAVTENVIAIAGPSGKEGCRLEERGSSLGPRRMVLRRSACLSSGAKTSALTDQVALASIQNVTSIATGPNSDGAVFSPIGFREPTIVKASIFEGTLSDIFAVPAGQSFGEVTFEKSVYDKHREFRNPEGAVDITLPGTNGNITAEPKLAADNIHELPGSPTIDAGIGGEGCCFDLDPQQRVIGPAVDIGADEIAESTTDIACTPEDVSSQGNPSTCVATVTDTDNSIIQQFLPSGTVTFAATGAGNFNGGATCNLTRSGTSTRIASCQVTYSPQGGSGSHTITASFGGDLLHDSSTSGPATVISEPAAPPPPPTVRFAAPGVTASNAPCTNQGTPCSLAEAASLAQAGDEVQLAPGTYGAADLADDEANPLSVRAGVTLAGDPTNARPVISANASDTLVAATDSSISFLKIQNQGEGAALTLNGGSLEDVIASASTGDGCRFEETAAVARLSACLSAGAGSSALATDTRLDLQNVTAVATGANSSGGQFFATAANAPNVTATSTIFEGSAEDLLGVAKNGAGSVTLENSAFDTTRNISNGGKVDFTVPGANGNITAPPRLAADNIHQLSGSPTRDAGTNPPLGTRDTDGQARVLGAIVDIGADEFGRSSVTLACTPEDVGPNSGASNCVATVRDPDSASLAPRGTVTFTATGAGSFNGGATCNLTASNGATSCQVTYTAQPGSGSHTISAASSGDSFHWGTVSNAATVASVSPGGKVRFAAAGDAATGAAPCTSQASPCSLEEAVGIAQEEDEVQLAPGNYDSGDLSDDPGNPLIIPAGVDLAGDPSKGRPVISSAASDALVQAAGSTVSFLKIDNSGEGTALKLTGGEVEDVIATSQDGNGCVLNDVPAAARRSVCLSAGESAAALATNTTLTLQNVTAIATGPESTGGLFSDDAANVAKVTATASIFEGTEVDLLGQAATQADGEVTLQASAYDKVRDDSTDPGAVSFTTPGTNGNVSAAPKLAADNIHQLSESPTLDAGSGAEAGTVDVDGQARTIGTKVDIGADELGHSTTTIACNPGDVGSKGGASTCVATVSDADAAKFVPGGTVTFAASGAGAFNGGASCSLNRSGANATCQVTYSPQAGSGSNTITGTYGGDLTHAPSRSGNATVTSNAAPRPPKSTPPNTTIVKKPRARTAKALASFTFSSNQKGVRFECKLDRGRFAPCKSPFTKKVKRGRHSLVVRAVNAAGEADPTPAEYRWRRL